jgi:hypothetical protein
MRCWPEPLAGEMVWCHFPDNKGAKPEPRPGLILLVKEDDEAMIFVNVAYANAGLSHDSFQDTKLDLNRLWEVPFIDEYFLVPPHAPHGQTPKLGILHPSLVRIVSAAFTATRSE